MSKYDDREELAFKVDWEGGLTEAILGYGITADDLPEDTPSEIVEAWKRIDAVSPEERMVSHWLQTGEVKKYE